MMMVFMIMMVCVTMLMLLMRTAAAAAIFIKLMYMSGLRHFRKDTFFHHRKQLFQIQFFKRCRYDNGVRIQLPDIFRNLIDCIRFHIGQIGPTA